MSFNVMCQTTLFDTTVSAKMTINFCRIFFLFESFNIIQ